MIAPYRRRQQEPRPVGWLSADPSFTHGEQGIVPTEAAIGAGWSIWAPSERLRQHVRAGNGSCLLWRFSPIGWSPDGENTGSKFPVRGLQLPTIPADPDQALVGLVHWRDWLHSYGARPAGSLGGSGMSLIKATLRRPLWTAVGDLPPITYTLGARQQDGGPRPAHYRGWLNHYDIQAAYASVLGTVRYGGRWVRYERDRLPDPAWVDRLDAHQTPIFARARVTVPDSLPWWSGPLPRRPRGAARSGLDQMLDSLVADQYPVGRRIQGVWTWSEIQQAAEAGCKVKILDVWIHSQAEQPLLRWLEAIWQGREMGGFAGQLAKATGNATWGQFAIARDGQRIIEPGTRKAPLRGGNPSQRAHDLGEWITGNVRAQLYRGIRAAGQQFVSAHTDGVWVQDAIAIDWRRNRSCSELRILTPQAYAYRAADEEWHYTVAGALDPASFFEDKWQRLQRQEQPSGLGHARHQVIHYLGEEAA